MHTGWKWSLILALALAGACDVKGRAVTDGGDPGFIDAAVIDPPPPPPPPPPYGDADVNSGDGGCAPASCTNPVDDGCGGVDGEVCNNGLDDDCDGQIDEDCTCSVGSVQSCFLGPPGRANEGACTPGTQTCQGAQEFGHWGPCTGGIFPTSEVCDGLDNNCNGCADDDPECCDVLTHCPGPGDLPEAQPFSDYMIDGGHFFGGSAIVKWTWTVEGGPCDKLLQPSQSFTLNNMQVSTVTGHAIPVVTFHPTLSGDYTFTVTVKHADGTVETCTFIVHVRGPGLRVELCWEKTGSADMDLHLHKPGSTADWTSMTDDCQWMSCRANDTALPWGNANSDISECKGTPDGAEWMALGYCRNPRLDIDNIRDPGKPENINVDTPREGETFRVAVHYFSGQVITHPIVNIYCGGSRLGTFGQIPDQLQNFNEGFGGELGPTWRVVDVTTHVDAMGNTTGCDLAPLSLPSDPGEPFVTCPQPGSPDDCSDLSY